MLRINRNQKTFCVLDTPTLSDASITERYDLQEFICNSPQAFFGELGQDLFVIGKEILPSATVLDRIDILAIDKEGNLVVVELKRGNHKLQLFQAISYAGMIAHWTPEDVLSLLDAKQQDRLLNEFLECARDGINRKQRILLVAEAYDYALLVGAEWLNEQYGVDVACCRIAVAKDTESNAEYLVCSNVYPAPELVNEAVSRGRKSEPSKSRWGRWEEALASITNNVVKGFFERELPDNESYLPRRLLRFRVGGKRRFNLLARTDRAYVWQEGRFDGDVEHWQRGLSDSAGVKPVKSGRALRMFLYDESDFTYFKKSVTETLSSATWTVEAALEESDDETAE